MKEENFATFPDAFKIRFDLRNHPALPSHIKVLF
jgi:hypothetical protein